MCGISGFISPDFAQNSFKKTIYNMVNEIDHRGPDRKGIWFDYYAGVALGHNRLSIVDLSEAGNQPMISSCKRYYIVFNGEIYNHKSLREKLPDSINWQGHSDTETLINGISCWGLKNTLRELVGMFAFAIWDRKKKKLTLVRDRLGEKPLYYGFRGNTMIFSSELKAIETFPEKSLKINKNSLGLYMRFGYIPSPYSIYEGIYKLPPGSFVEFTIEDVKERLIPCSTQYWSLESITKRQQSNTFLGTHIDAIDYLECLLKDTISGQMQGDVPIGAFLSGGIDSSTVVSIMQSQSKNPLNTFTVGFQEFGYDESKSARAISSFIGTNHNDLVLSSAEAMKTIPYLPEIYDEPFSDVSQIPTFLISKFASKNVKVCLSGDGGDELFCGYSRHIAGPKIWRIFNKIPKPIRKICVNFIHSLPPTTWDRFYFFCEYFLPKHLRINFPGLKIYKISDLINNDSLFEVYISLISSWKAPEDIILNYDPSKEFYDYEVSNIKLNDPHHQMMYFDSLIYLPNDILVKVDRAAMSSSLETRLPLLDHRIIEFAWSIPLSMKLKDKKSKWLLRQVLKKYLPNNLIEKPKTGFSVPIGEWLRGPLKNWANELLDEKLIDSHQYFSSKSIQQKWKEHLTGRKDWSKQIWTILMFQSWLMKRQN
ncbi:asparagine synthase (glutamine-hydrolyzing) [Prochlorococcus marinus]|uniref:asparagine synthase (glutamine-hydrolyzing) n=1 Tax=Prochlorococcus marinus TaxID=1219 RepID=UPI001ADCB831|nr:asparagine synthase (glutamine-hydrolyzing) [Prochlorococcus marinus]MBO8217672.1 asparagine synthase (glutamine-hydrolyzing) [Prochlorococcus marinus XMU1405]MBW3040834.1 asparagine synthase (glutamine-hydrolyzing) [Prochlorococcus marinus str. MU1405]MBW3048293.1 asparagine synthase (glutamine-hydrolyzing) [Prochlorococcus marinus str. MU1406]